MLCLESMGFAEKHTPYNNKLHVVRFGYQTLQCSRGQQCRGYRTVLATQASLRVPPPDVEGQPTHLCQIPRDGRRYLLQRGCLGVQGRGADETKASPWPGLAYEPRAFKTLMWKVSILAKYGAFYFAFLALAPNPW